MLILKVIGRVYEYFLKEFAVNATKEEDEYYTPHDVVQLIAAMIEPYDGTLYEKLHYVFDTGSGCIMARARFWGSEGSFEPSEEHIPIR
jgi:type I restriction enzyme M protein